MSVIVRDKSTDDCETTINKYLNRGYSFISMMPTKENAHIFEDGYWDLTFKK